MPKYYMDDNGKCWERKEDLFYPGHPDYMQVWIPAPYYANNLNAYLFFGPNIHIEPTDKPICLNVPELKQGSSALDGGYLTLTEDEKNELLRTDPDAEILLRPFMMGKDFINRKPRWCLWLLGVEPADIRKCPRVLERIERVREFRLKSKRKGTLKAAETPALFSERRFSRTDYLAIPVVSSSTRQYIPIDWLKAEIIPGNKIFFCENATLYQFGILNSVVHMSWVRKISGRLRNDYSYSNTIDYNAFPWPNDYDMRHGERERIESTAQMILDARAKYPRSSLADLYDERTMPPELRKAHKLNDSAVLEAYGFEQDTSELDIVIALMYMYKDITGCDEYGPDGELIYD